MTISEFARLCGCGTQTLRYYDKIDLLKPAKVDPWSAYRCYAPEQAVAFVKIKNLQAADFSIQEIKGLLTQPDEVVYSAFAAKITAQEEKLAQIRKIQKNYLDEKNTMEKLIHSMTDYLLSQCGHPEVLEDFGLPPADAPVILERLRQYLNTLPRRTLSPEQVTMTVNGEVIRGQAAVLERIASLTSENLTDTILLNDGLGHGVEENGDPEPDFGSWDVLWERAGWEHVRDFLGELPRLETGMEYCLWVRRCARDLPEDLSFALFLLGAVLSRQQGEGIVVNCSVTEAQQEENLFRLFGRAAADPLQ